MNITRLSPVRALLTGLLALLLSLPGAWPELAGARQLEAAPHQQRTARLVGELLSQYHYREEAVGDPLAEKALEAYLDLLDPQRYYFLAADIREFRAFQHRLDEQLLAGELDAALHIYERFTRRVLERSAHAGRLLTDEPAFDENEALELDRREADWAESPAELDGLWRQRVRHDALTLRLTGLEWEKVRETLADRYQRIARTTEESKIADVFELYMMAWGHAYDPHSAYMSPRSAENFDIHMRLSLEGIGAMLKSSNDFTEIVELITGGPAARSEQLKPGDRIIGVAQGRSGEMKDVVGMRLQDVVDLIRGHKGTVVRLQILPTVSGGTATPREVSLVRNEIQLEEQAAQAEVIETPDARRIGVISIPAFYSDFAAAEAGKKNYRSTTRDVHRLIEELQQEQRLDGLIVDLRGNGGGALNEAVDLTGLFIDRGPVVQIRDSAGRVEVLQDQNAGTAWDGPLGVLVDRYSASASEIFAAAIQDYQRGLVIGETTFGKGTVQTLIPLDRFSLRRSEPAGRLKLTIAKFYRVNGASTQLRGVEPDLKLPSPDDESDYGERAVANALPWDRIRPVSYQPDEGLGPLLPRLRDHYEQHIGESAAFQALLEEYAQIRSLQGQTRVSLNESARRAQRESFSTERLEALNRRRAAYELPPLQSLDEAEQDESTPDTLLRAAAAVVSELARLSSPTGTGPLHATQASR
ncbi:carboxy terminal-processing peptidase [Alkalilimnicola sp. S0819]|uniref:carboxy terminal-processing peptidase n=1 Tax=Alkalilimnicola sp. S0819 TaxID=2613922 RepID=UPI001261EFCB|nr:carboxy terminal-processing peptidase [Alkalilimnicola sp. S0819]KAB7622651.1 peptidase S41 [Alkalilimnicola sp. S0819]MPQ17422.1 peptidase S41 [Alkalilimnicola sp. S0819]